MVSLLEHSDDECRVPKKEGNASANTAVAATEGDTVPAHPTRGGLGYRVKHVSFAVDSKDNSCCSGTWAVDSGATDHVADPALLRFLSTQVSNYYWLNELGAQLCDCRKRG